MDSSHDDMTIGVLGSTQIKHLMPVLSEQYKVVDIQEKLDARGSKIGRLITFVSAIKKVDVVYNVFTQPKFYRKLWLAKLFGKKVVTHWIGSDVRLALEDEFELEKFSKMDKHFVCFKSLQDDLVSVGINAEILPIVPFNMNLDLCNQPKEHAVLVYMPEGKESLYGRNDICQTASAFPDVTFYIVANTNKSMFASYSNIVLLGYLDSAAMANLYEKVSTLVRMHLSDGLSMMVIEALAKGKNVIWDHEFPYVLPGNGAEEIIDSMKKVLERSPFVNYDAHDFIIREYTKESYLKVFDSAL